LAVGLSKVDLRFPIFFVEPPMVHCSNSSLISTLVTAYSRAAENCKQFRVALEYVLSVHRNLLESGWGHYETASKSVMQWFFQYLLFLQYISYWTAGKMANVITHQKNILKIEKPVVVFRPRTILWILSRDPVPLKTEGIFVICLHFITTFVEERPAQETLNFRKMFSI
jgi:hypothetical protein